MITSKKAVLYARKSTVDDQHQVQSIDDQIRAMKKIARDEGIEIVEILRESQSAKAPGKRPVFKQMMRNIEDGKYSVIVVWDTSRLSRNPKDGGDLQWMLNDGILTGIRTHEKWYHDDDDLLFTIENSMNGRFIKELRAKVSRGMTSKAEKGDYPSNPPVGYTNDRLKKTIIKDDIMFDRVAELWRMALTGTYSISELERIASDKLLIRSPQTEKPLCHNSIRRLLTNPFYMGKFQWGGRIYNGNHPAMITEAEFEKMQEILGKTKNASRPQKNLYDFVLRGLLRCAECGHAIVTEKKFKKLRDGSIKEYHYCHCCGKSVAGKCKNHSIYVSEDDVINQIKDELSRYTIDEDFFKLAIEALAEEDEMKTSKQNEKIASLNRQIADKTNELNGLRRALYKGLIPDEAYFLSEQEAISKDIEKLESDLDKAKSVAIEWKEVATDVFMFARYAKEDFDSDDWERKRTVIKKLGADLRLSGRTVQFTPVKYLIPIKNNGKFLEAIKEAARTAPEQIKKDLKEDLISSWYTRQDSNL